MKLSLALATYNEENNLSGCLESIKALVNEIIIADGGSTDRTIQIAKKYGAKIIKTDNPPMFHINKQKAIDEATGDWILQLDADERVTPELAIEIKKVIGMSEKELQKYEENLPEKRLFEKHQYMVDQLRAEDRKLKVDIENRGLKIEKNLTSNFYHQHPSSTFNLPSSISYNAFFIPRLNCFLGKYLRYGGVYPDGVIRLFKKGKAHLPCRDVHELMEVEGKTGWLRNPLLHIDSPTFSRYLERNSRYIDHLATEITYNIEHRTKNKNKFHVTCYMLLVGINYLLIKPFLWFVSTTFRHKGILDGWQGVVFSFFSALRFPRAYWRCMTLPK